jgi:hypothetical protein
VNNQLNRRTRLAVGRHVDDASGIDVKPVVANISNDSGDLGEVVSLPFPEDDLLADGVFAGPQKISNCRADDDAPRSCTQVRLPKAAAL